MNAVKLVAFGDEQTQIRSHVCRIAKLTNQPFGDVYKEFSSLAHDDSEKMLGMLKNNHPISDSSYSKKNVM